MYLLGALIVIVVAWFAASQYFAKLDQQNHQNEAAQKAAANTAKAQNPFQAQNPLSGVEANPLSKTKKILNPFEP